MYYATLPLLIKQIYQELNLKLIFDITCFYLIYSSKFAISFITLTSFNTSMGEMMKYSFMTQCIIVILLVLSSIENHAIAQVRGTVWGSSYSDVEKTINQESFSALDEMLLDMLDFVSFPES